MSKLLVLFLSFMLVVVPVYAGKGHDGHHRHHSKPPAVTPPTPTPPPKTVPPATPPETSSGGSHNSHFWRDVGFGALLFGVGWKISTSKPTNSVYDGKSRVETTVDIRGEK